MTTFGQTPEGFNPKILRDVLSEVEADQRADIDPAIDTSPQSPTGQHNGVFARQTASAWEVLKKSEDGLDPDKAEGDQLIALCKLTGTVPRGATFSEVDCDCTLDIGTPLVTNVAFASVDGRPDILFTPKANFTAPSTGTHSVRFRAETAGPVIANAGSLTVIATSTPGWSSVTNPFDAVSGLEADGANDDWNGLRARRENELAKAGSATARALRADLLNITDANGSKPVVNAQVLENDTDYTDANGLPPHSIEALVYDSPSISNDVIAQTIFDGKAGGIRAVGSLTGTALDEDGNAYTVAFTRPTQRQIWITYDLTTGSNYIGDTEFKSRVVQALRAEFSVGDDVFQWVCETVAKLTGVKNVVSCKIGFTASPTLENDLEITPREIATFDTTRVVIT